MADAACPGCRRVFKIKDGPVGRKGKCPHCGHTLTVPASSGGRLSEVRTAAEAATLPPEPAPPLTEDSRRETQSDADATGGAAAASPLTDFLAPPQGPDEIGRLGPYRVLAVLGAGGMGVVYRAEDPHLRRMVALKVMLPSLASSASARERFLREARTAAAVEHDNVVAIYQVGEDRGVPFLAMPLLRGESLDQRIKREGALPLADALRIARETATGLEAARKRGLIHRDIKPANLWLEEETGRVKILDFGLARAADGDAQLTTPGAILGTPAYMAPEQAGGPADHRADLFSLGCVLYRMATGHAPFKGTDTISTLMAVATEEPPPPDQVRPGLPRSLSELVLRMLAKNPEDRPASAQAVVEAIRAIEADPTQAVPPPGRPPAPKAKPALKPAAKTQPKPDVRKAPAPQKKNKGGGILWIGAAALALTAALAVGYLMTHPFSAPMTGGGHDPSNPNVGPPAADRWQPLFNDHDLTGWAVSKGNKHDNWGVEDDILYTTGARRNWLLTDHEYGDFEVRLEYRLTEKANSGVGMRASADGEKTFDGLEVQLIDEAGYGPGRPALPSKELNGALFGLAPPSGTAAAPLGLWNRLEVFARGREIKVKLNDSWVLQADLNHYKDQAAKFPGVLRTKGRIGLQSHTGRVEFRRLFVRPLAAEAAPDGLGGLGGGVGP